MISNPRRNVKRSSGRVAFFVRNGIVVEILRMEKNECCFIKVTFTSSVSKLFCVTYPPEKLQFTSFLPNFEKFPLTMKTFNVETIIFGDFNENSLIYNQMTNRIKNLLNAYALHICKKEPTWVTAGTKS